MEDPEELDQFDEEEMEEMIDPMEALASFLSTEDGETIATSLAGLKDAAVLVTKHMEKQNMILIKMMTAINSFNRCECCAPKNIEA
jgi:flagellin-specific chaperone FliS